MGGPMAVIKSIFGICETKPLDPGSWELDGGTVRVKLGQAASLSTRGGAVYLKGEGLDKPILILRTSDDKYLACADTCTHAGRKLDPVPGNPVLRCCSVGHSTFDYDGKVIKGPANRPLTRYEAELSGDDLLVHIE